MSLNKAEITFQSICHELGISEEIKKFLNWHIYTIHIYTIMKKMSKLGTSWRLIIGLLQNVAKQALYAYFDIIQS